MVIVNQAAPRRLRNGENGGAGEQRRVYLTGTFTEPSPNPRPLEFWSFLTDVGFITGGTFFVAITPNQPLTEPVVIDFGFTVLAGTVYIVAGGQVVITGPQTVTFNVFDVAKGTRITPFSEFFISYNVFTPVSLTVQVLNSSFVSVA